MKTVLKLTIAMAMMLSTTAGMANEPKISLIENGDVKGLIFELDSQSTETVVKLMDSEDHIIYYEHLPVGRYAKKFNLSGLKAGLYYLSTEDPIKDIVYTVDIRKTDMKFKKWKENVKPVFRKEGDKLFLNLLNLDMEKVEIKVFDSSNRILFKEVVKGDVQIEKAFNFENAYEDTYKVVVNDKGNLYYEYVTVD
ncbi:MAG TPA: hypothetical protein VKN36_14945 [Eudoraea sp.]|nr:hypothetical protein [Eudoraea sp.]